jgi:anti-sigma regulatory factor (Ser/Thr protein kinase)
MKIKSIAVISTDQTVNTEIGEVCDQFAEDFEPVFLKNEERIVQFLNYELPEINVINCSDTGVDVKKVAAEIRNDPWLHYGGIIIVTDDEDECVLSEYLAGLNLIAFIPRSRLSAYFRRVLRILSLNRHILFQRDIHALLRSNLFGSFTLENDPFDLATYSNLLANFLYNANLISREQRETFYVAVMELLVNALEHGNCRITHEEKSEYMARGLDPMDLIREKAGDPEIQGKRLYLSYRIRPDRSHFHIRDEGSGFDWMSYTVSTGIEGMKKGHGRGILMARLYLKNLTYNQRGNEVSFEIDHLTESTNAIPHVFSEEEEVAFEPGDVVFQEGEKSSHLYYIVSGRYDVFAAGRKVSTLTPLDLFVGEMSFLLNNRRSAKVQCVAKGVLIRVSKENFVNSIKGKPHYGIFLARLLAQRLVKLHTVAGS